MDLTHFRFISVERIGYKLSSTLTMLVTFSFFFNGAVVRAQMPIPVATSLITPLGLDFHGEWTCRDGASVAHIKVQEQHHGHSTLDLSGLWTALTERQEGITLHYFIGYDRDKNELLMIDADDPASLSYLTEGWRGTHLIFKSVDASDREFPSHQICYEIKSSKQFTVSWEILDGGRWIGDPVFTCNKTSQP